MIVNFLLIVFILLRAIIGVRLLWVARQNKLSNLYWLAVQFIFVAIGALFVPTAGNPVANFPFSLWLFLSFTGPIPQILNITFTQTTFYQNRKSPVWLFVGLSTISIVISLYGAAISQSNYEQNPLVAWNNVGILITWFWHGWAAYEAFTAVAKDEAVEDWVKARYQLIIAYTIIFGVAAIGSLVRVYAGGGSTVTPLGNAMGILTLLSQIVGVTVQFLVWVMPENFRNWLNRNQKAREIARIHQKAIAIFDIIGGAMSKGTGVSKMLALFAIRKTIGAKLKTDNEALIEAHVLQMNYNEWLQLLKEPELFRLLKNVTPSGGSPQEIVMKAETVLIERQSLFTLQAK